MITSAAYSRCSSGQMRGFIDLTKFVTSQTQDKIVRSDIYAPLDDKKSQSWHVLVECGMLSDAVGGFRPS